MPISFLPRAMTDTVTEVRPEWLHARNIRLLMLDFDNTIVPYTTSTPAEEVDQWLVQMLDSDIQVCVVSNSKRDRVKIFCEKYGLHCITHAGKPGTKGILECLRKFGCKPEEAMLIGDQIYTDTLGGNRAGVRTVLVKSIHNHTFWLKLRHVAELPFIAMARKRRICHEKS